MRKKPLPSQDYLRSILDYDPETGVFTWKERSDIEGLRNRCSWNGKHAGKRAGTCRAHGYRMISINRTDYCAHKLAWKYVYGIDPVADLDHANGDTDDNRIANLREATRSQNNQNKRGWSKHGLKGVYQQRTNGRFGAQIRDKGKIYYLGTFDTPEEAHAAYVAEAVRLFGEFARAA